MNEEQLIKKYVPSHLQEEAFKKLANNYPIQYIIGNVDFCDCQIEVNENVLIPRFETELLVDKTLKYLKKVFNRQMIKIADLGTGSGAIAIALKKNFDCQVDAYDISQRALDLAKKNAKNNIVDINFINQDIRLPLNDKYDCLISNPPYLKEDEPIAEPVKYEPMQALYAKDEGLEFYKKILANSKDNLSKKFIIAFEIGLNQEDKIISCAKEIYPEAKMIIEKDLNNINRYVFIINE